MAAISWERTGRKFIYDECFHDGFFLYTMFIREIST